MNSKLIHFKVEGLIPPSDSQVARQEFNPVFLAWSAHLLRKIQHESCSLEHMLTASSPAKIKAYIAIRDDLLTEAEQLKTLAKLDSVTVANDFVQSCLNPARPPYHSQCLPDPDAVRERKRCHAVKSRIAELRSQIA